MDSESQGIYLGNIMNDCVGTNVDEMPAEATEQLDFIDNTTFNYIETLAKESGIEELEWNMELIGTINDFVINYLKAEGIPIWYPYISDEEEK